MQHTETILILDFGSQYTQLIARRIRESKVYSEIHPYNYELEKIKELNPSGIILSGGPMSVYDSDSPDIDSSIFELGVPVLGICYGLQIISSKFNGKVDPAENREYGKAELRILNESKLLKGVSVKSQVWMSHGDLITEPPKNFNVDGETTNSPIAAVSNEQESIYGLQFHPEVFHSTEGPKIIENFLFNVCGCSGNWTAENFIEDKVQEIRELVGDKKALLALSGGVDSSVAAVLLDRAIGENLVCIHVDTGLMRKNESSKIENLFRENYHFKLDVVDAKDQFLKALKGVIDPEKKRKIIGGLFIDIFEQEANKFENVDFLVQGTLYPDVIESVSVKGASVTIKSHHNVGGMPEKMNLKLIEPFRELFKDEVREIGEELGLPKEFSSRHPFPGPGLAVRILGDVDEEKLRILRDVDDIYISELKEADLYKEIWQAFAVLLPVRTVGVMGDARTYENVIALRAVTSIDGMTADWYKFSGEFLEHVSNKIIREIKGVNRVVYDISSKPPATIEWE
jgi:GMP synthase (glutamine-hydrolysing)